MECRQVYELMHANTHACTKRKKEKNNLGITLNAFSNPTMKTYGTENKIIHDEVFQDYRMKIKSELS